MAFDPLERSASAGRPEELYEFYSQAKFWRYTSAAQVATLNNNVFEPVRAMRRTALKQDKDGGDDSIEVTVPLDNEVAMLFRIIVPARTIWLRIWRRHRGTDDYSQVWYGRVRGVGWKGSRAIISCDGLNSMFKRGGLRLNYDVKCPHMLYGPGCNLDKDQFRVDGPLTFVSKNTVKSPAFASLPDQHLRLGFLEFGYGYYMISDHVGDTVTTFAGVEFDIDDRPATVTAYWGCDRMLQTCWSKFNNGLNSEANAWHPNVNPFEKGV